MTILINLALLMVGFVLLIKGADYFVEGASKIADRYHIPQIVIGLTIVAFGTSAPEAAISITSALQGNAGIAIGNVVGSNIMNILLIIGITSIILPLKIQKNTLRFELPYVIFVTTILLLLGKADGILSIVDGLILWGLFLIFFSYLFWLSKKGEAVIDEIEEADENDTLPKLLFLTVGGLVAIVLGSRLTIDGATGIAEIFGMDERFIGLTIVAFGTSLPELITCITAALKGKDDIAIGNIIGSNLFNILFVIGTTCLIQPVEFASGFLFDTLIAVASAVLLFLFVLPKLKVSRISGFLMLVAYAVYFVQLFITTMNAPI